MLVLTISCWVIVDWMYPLFEIQFSQMEYEGIGLRSFPSWAVYDWNYTRQMPIYSLIEFNVHSTKGSHSEFMMFSSSARVLIIPMEYHHHHHQHQHQQQLWAIYTVWIHQIIQYPRPGGSPRTTNNYTLANYYSCPKANFPKRNKALRGKHTEWVLHPQGRI